MELPRRRPDDVHLPEGSFRERIRALGGLTRAHGLRIGLVYAFDARTRMLPFWYADRRMAPYSVRLLGDALHEAGFTRLRIVLQQWSPNVLPSRMRLDGRPLDILMVSSMQVHAERAYALIRDAHRMGAARPLILVGGPKAIYEPTDLFELGPQPGIGADCVVTGEVFVLLELLHTILADRQCGHSAREAFDAARRAGTLEPVAGLVYLSPDASPHRPVAVNTGVQRLLRDLDELPLPDAGYRMIEPPHRRRELSAEPCSPRRVGRLSRIASVTPTQGCRYRCSYCPISGANQQTWRHKSPRRFAAEIKHLHETFGIRTFFGTDDNFFNRRETVAALMEELAKTTVDDMPIGRRIELYTEATQADVFRHRDLLPLCRQAGVAGLWFGIEDLSGKLVRKGQSAGKSAELFALMHRLGIAPHVMMIHSDAQPLRSRSNDLSGLLNQAGYLFAQGAASYQCTYLGPSVGTRDVEKALASGAVFRRVGGRDVPQAYHDGNHVVASKHPRPHQQQWNLLRAYACFYNPRNLLQALRGVRRSSVARKRVLHQLIGQIGLLMTVPKLARWARRLARGPIGVWDALPRTRIPMIDVRTRKSIPWSVELPEPDGADELPELAGLALDGSQAPFVEVAAG